MVADSDADCHFAASTLAAVINFPLVIIIFAASFYFYSLFIIFNFSGEQVQ